MRSRLVAAALLIAMAGAAAAAGREPVLKQVDLPHSYYWRELYLPQLTSGPSSASFLPDGQSLVYSMAGSLWRQRIGDGEAVELTHAQGAYDYQPDVARDGRSVVFTRYDGAGMELWRLDLATGRSQALTRGGAVNVEPRLSPDGKRIAWVSTQGTGHFNLFVADIDGNGLHNARPLLGERKSKLDRYYYSAYDHAINPSWSPDGKQIVFVGNAEIAWGSGDLWSVEVERPKEPRKILREETSWSARPELAPDGKRLLYAGYHGRQTHQLWLTTLQGAPPLPLTFGDSERRNARWSPDGHRIAYIGQDAAGNIALSVMDVIGGATQSVVAKQRRTLAATARLQIQVRDGRGRNVPARVSVQGSDHRAQAPAEAWMHADDGFDRALQATESHYFHCDSPCTLDVPAGSTTVSVQHGFAHLPWSRNVELAAGSTTTLHADLQAQALPAAFGSWRSADLHVHMNYGGHYANSPEHLALQARAEDLDIVENLIVNKEQRIPDIAWFGKAGPAGQVRIDNAQEFHTSFWGHLGLLNLRDHYLTPDFSAYRHTAMASPFPHNGVIADLAHAQQGVVGYVHPFDTVPDPVKDAVLSHQLPADVANGKVDYLEVVGFSDHKATAAVWYRLLNLGYRLPAGAGTDAMANYASLRGPVGMNRVFLEQRSGDDVLASLKQGHSFVSNGPLLGLIVSGRKPGDTLSLSAPGRASYRVALRSPVAIQHLELVQDGRVVKQFALTGDRRSFDAEGELELAQGGWVLLRAWNDGADPQVLDLYPYATTNPVWLDLPGGVPPAGEDAAYFAAWLGRVIEAADARDDYNDAEEKRATLDYLRAAQAIYQGKAGGH
ncbi:CehA/McbA family metallohydrolase [Lysobacter sp. GCM10012299]|uniref:CehA/McbA family metallohydrolase n=1 Tax=Lysobacter sp. GCM10012299 TaxID=3317333 RepID=UPI00361CE01A